MYNGGMMIKKSKNMTKMMNLIAYGGKRPANVSPARWSAMKKFFKRNFKK
tara:strand:- start:511 stop:660 length:150 start_codon:yes stop_codon:yes gene_type:complete